MKKKTRRSEAQYPNLNPRLNLKRRQEFLDYDYVNKLSEKEKQFLDDFSNEFYNADFKTHIEAGRKRIHKIKKGKHEKTKYLQELVDNLARKIRKYIKILHSQYKVTKNEISLELSELLKSVDNSPIQVVTRKKIKKFLNEHNRALQTLLNRQYDATRESYKKEIKQLRKMIKKEFLYIGDVYKKEAQDANNARNRCDLTLAQAQNKTISLSYAPEKAFVINDLEDQIIEKIDSELFVAENGNETDHDPDYGPEDTSDSSNDE